MHSLTFSLSLTGADARTRAHAMGEGLRISPEAARSCCGLHPLPLAAPPFTPPAAPIPRGARYYLKKGGASSGRGGCGRAGLALCVCASGFVAGTAFARSGRGPSDGCYQPPARSFSRPRRAAARRKSLLSSRKSLLSSALSLAARYSVRYPAQRPARPLMQGALPPATRNHGPVPAATPGALPPAPRHPAPALAATPGALPPLRSLPAPA